MNEKPENAADAERILDIHSSEFEGIAREILASGRSLRFRARGRSMRPFVYDGDILEMGPLQADSLRVGDIVMITNAHGGLVVHRVIRLEGRAQELTLQTQGDANRTPDGEIPIDQALARLARIERGGKTLRQDSMTQRLLGRLWVVLAPAIKWIYYRLRGL